MADARGGVTRGDDAAVESLLLERHAAMVREADSLA